MNLATISLGYLKARRLNTALNVLLLALGIATITLLLLTTSQLEERMQRDARGIDLVVGAKGSPMQIILSSIYQLDVPTGNVSWKQAQELARHRMVKKVIPLALGDNHKGFRIVGTNHDYVAHYGAQPAGIFNHMQLAMRSLSMQGFFYFAEQHRWAAGRERLARWLADGSIRDTLDIAEGFDCVPEVAIGQFSGGVKGRKLIRLAADPGAGSRQ